MANIRYAIPFPPDAVVGLILDALLSPRCGNPGSMEVRVPDRPTARQGQFPAFIYYYTKLHGQPPAEWEMAQYFRVSAPAVHQMVVTLDRRGFIERTPGKPRSIRLLLSRDQLPDLGREGESPKTPSNEFEGATLGAEL